MTNDITNKLSLSDEENVFDYLSDKEKKMRSIILSDEEKQAFEFLHDDVRGCLSESAIIISDARRIIFSIMNRLEKYNLTDISILDIQKTQSELRALHGYLEFNLHWIVDVSAGYENKHLLKIMDLYETLD